MLGVGELRTNLPNFAIQALIDGEIRNWMYVEWLPNLSSASIIPGYYYSIVVWPYALAHGLGICRALIKSCLSFPYVSVFIACPWCLYRYFAYTSAARHSVCYCYLAFPAAICLSTSCVTIFSFGLNLNYWL